MLVDGAVLNVPSWRPFGSAANQLEVSPDGRWLYIQALNGAMSRIPFTLLTEGRRRAPASGARLIARRYFEWGTWTAPLRTRSPISCSLYPISASTSAVCSP